MSSQSGQPGQMNHREITIETLSTPPPKISPAPLFLRIVACIIDSFIITTLYAILAFTAKGYIGLTPGFADAVYLIALTFCYYTVQEGIFAATVGKFVAKLRVVGKDGDPCSFLASCIRNVLRFADWLPIFYLIGGTAILVSSRRQRLGDTAAATTVVRVPEKDINPPPAPFLFH